MERINLQLYEGRSSSLELGIQSTPDRHSRYLLNKKVKLLEQRRADYQNHMSNYTCLEILMLHICMW